jgi:hypothetical protein
MAPPTDDEEPKFRFRVNIMPPRRPANSLFKRINEPQAEEPLHIIAVPARASEKFADVWKHIKERYERNYTAEEVAKGWFHKLQDRYGADIDSHDGVGELGYTINSPKEDLVLIMLQNGIDRDGSVPETSGLRPPGFCRPELSVEQEQQAKRRKLEEERYGVALEEMDEDTAIESRERSLGIGSPELAAPANCDDNHRIDADGFAVPLLPGSVSRKRKRPQTTRGDIIPSSMEGENDDDILVEDSQTASQGHNASLETVRSNAPTSRPRSIRSMPADASAGASMSSTRASRARTTAPVAIENQAPLRVQRLAALQTATSKSTSSLKGAESPPKSPPTPVSAASQTFSQQPPESAQRPKPTPLIASTPIVQRQHQLATERVVPEDELDFDPIEDDDLLQGIEGTANDDSVDTNPEAGPAYHAPLSSTVASAKSKPGKLAKPKKTLSLTPKAGPSASKQSVSTPTSNALRLSGSQSSSTKNPRSQTGTNQPWSSEEDKCLLQGLREGLNAAQIVKRFSFEGRTPSAVRGRRAALHKQNPGIELAATQINADVEQSAKKRRNWSIEEKQIMSRAISDGFDALEIHAMHFPSRSEDSVSRAVLSLQDQAWKVASMGHLYPGNPAGLLGWTPKDACKLRRTILEGLETQVAKKRYFSRWNMQEVQKQLDAYKKQYKAEEAADRARAPRTSSSTKKAVFGSFQMPTDSSQLPVNSSPVERSMQARAARRPSVDAQQRAPSIDVASSPPQDTTNEPSHIHTQNKQQSSNQEPRPSSPAVEISVTEQNSARENLPSVDLADCREKVSRPSSRSGRQSTINFVRDKGKKRAGPPRPTSEELDTQYGRHPTSSSAQWSATQPQEQLLTAVSRERSRGMGNDDNVHAQHDPAHDLEMLEAELEQNGNLVYQTSAPIEDGVVSEIQPSSPNETYRKDATMIRTATEVQNVSDVCQLSAGTAMTMQSPITTSSAASGRQRRSRVESGVDIRAAAQLSQELNRSLSREAHEDTEEREEAAHEDQVFSTPDPKIKRYHRAGRISTVTFSEDAVPQNGHEITEDNEPSQAQDPPTTRSQHATRVSFQTEPSPRGIDAGVGQVQGLPSLQPSPQISASESGGTATASVRPGKLPSRGPSYASRIRDIHKPPQPISNSAAKGPDKSPSRRLTDDTMEPARKDGSLPPPTDAEIWEKTAIAEAIGRDRQEYFEDLKISTFSIRAMSCGDWEEVRRLKAEERRLRRQRKIALGTYVISKRDTQHPHGIAQSGDANEADEDVIRADDFSDSSSEYESDGDENIWSDADFEQPPDVDHDRHFSEVEDDEEIEETNGRAARAIGVPKDADRSKRISEANDDEEMVDLVDTLQESAGVNNADEHEINGDKLELPTVQTLHETNGSPQHVLIDDSLQDPSNSGTEAPPTHTVTRKRKVDEGGSSPEYRRDKLQSDDRAAMPPPVKTNKRNQRRKRASGRRTSRSGSERSSSFSHAHTGSDAPPQHPPSTPVQSGSSAHRSKRARANDITPAEQTPKSSLSQTQQTTAGSQKAPLSSTKEVQRATGGGLSGLVRKAHIPTPPKVKRTPQKDNKARKLDIRADNEESDASSESD